MYREKIAMRFVVFILFVVIVSLSVDRKNLTSRLASAAHYPPEENGPTQLMGDRKGGKSNGSRSDVSRGYQGRADMTNSEDSAVRDALSSEENLRRWLTEPLSKREAHVRMEKIATILHDKANESGDFSGFDIFLACGDRAQVSPWIEMYLSGVTSQRGDVHDVQNKFRIFRDLEKLDRLGGQRLKMKIMEDAAPKILRSGVPELLEFFEGEELQRVASLGSRENPTKMIEIASQIVDVEKRRLAEDSAMQRFLETDSLAASSFVAQIADARTKKNLMATMVKWLKSKGDNDAAMSWQRQIDETRAVVPENK